VFYALTGWATATLPFALVAVCGRIISYGVVSYGWCRFSHAAGVPARWRVVSGCLFTALLLSGSLSGEWLIGGFESKVSAWGFCLLALASWMAAEPQFDKRRVFAIGGWIGVAMSIHPVVGAWCLIAIVMAQCATVCLAGRSEQSKAPVEPQATDGAIPWRELFRWNGGVVLTALLFSLPGVIPALKLVAGDDVSHERQQIGNYIQVFGRLKHHLDPTTFPPSAWRWLAVMLTLLFVVLRVRKASRQEPTTSSRKLIFVLVAALVIAGCGILIGWHRIPAARMTGWAWRAALLKFYPFRLLDVLLPAVLTVIVTQFVSQLRWFRESQGKTRPGRAFALPVISAVMTFTCLTWAVTQRHFPPASYTTTEFGDWCDVCDWIRNNTETDELIVTPRESFAFKWFAERAEYFAYKDCPQDAEGLIEWNRRNQFYSRWRGLARHDGIVEADELAVLAQETGGRWFVSRWEEEFVDSPIYANQTWRIYSLQTQRAAAEVAVR